MWISLQNWLKTLVERGFFYLFTANIWSQVIGFSTSLAVARLISPAELADAKILQSVVIVFLVLGGAGFNAAALKFCAENRPEAERLGLLGFSFRWDMATTALSLALLFILTITGVVVSTADLRGWLLLYAAAIPFIVLTDLLIVYLQATGEIRSMSAVQAVNRVITFAAIVAGTWFGGLGGFVIGSFVAEVLSVAYPLWKVGGRFFRSRPVQLPVGFYALAGFSLLTNAALILGQYGDMFILDHFVADRAAIGHYALATYFALAAMQITTTLQAILIPAFSRNAHDRAWVQHNLLQNQLFLSAASIFVAVGVWLAAWVIVQFLYGPAYAPTMNYLAVLLLRYIIFSAGAVMIAAYNGLGRVSWNLVAVGIATPVGLLLSYGLQKDFGVLGVAWAQVGAAVILLIILWAWQSVLKFRP
jgi:O-antigen/teichoic acid export membrane protein